MADEHHTGSDHCHLQEPVFTANVEVVYRALDKQKAEKVEVLTEGRAAEILCAPSCRASCRAEVMELLEQLELIRQYWMASFNKDAFTYPSWEEIVFVATEVESKPTLEGMFMLVNMVEDVLTTRAENSLVLKNQYAIEVLSFQNPEWEPDDWALSRKEWSTEGYRFRRMMQFRVKDREWLVPLFKKALNRFTDLNAEFLVGERP
ncbi:hypothetical protein FRB90_012592, partial [Tulasnella sp. 427]